MFVPISSDVILHISRGNYLYFFQSICFYFSGLLPPGFLAKQLQKQAQKEPRTFHKIFSLLLRLLINEPIIHRKISKKTPQDFINHQ